MSKRLTIWIDGREALPVRAIPYVTAWHLFTPDVVANYLAGVGAVVGNGPPLIAYHFIDGLPSAIKPREWDGVVSALEGYEADLKKIDPEDNHDIAYAQWRNQAALKLPAGVFVWLDEFQLVYDARQVTRHPGFLENQLEEGVDDSSDGSVQVEDLLKLYAKQHEYSEFDELVKSPLEKDLLEQSGLILAPMLDEDFRMAIMEAFITRKDKISAYEKEDESFDDNEKGSLDEGDDESNDVKEGKAPWSAKQSQPPGVPAARIKEAFPIYWGDKLTKCTSGRYEWLAGTWTYKGSRRARDANLFNPAEIASRLVEKDMLGKGTCSAIISKHFPEWASEWEKMEGYLRAS